MLRRALLNVRMVKDWKTVGCTGDARDRTGRQNTRHPKTIYIGEPAFRAQPTDAIFANDLQSLWYEVSFRSIFDPFSSPSMASPLDSSDDVSLFKAKKMKD